MAVNLAPQYTQRSYSWTEWKTARTARSGRHQFDDDGSVYTIWFYDGPEVHLCNIYKGTVPDGVVAGGYSQAQNDTDKTDFQNNYQPSANASIASNKKISYVVEVALAGANNKDMISIFNPAGSGKIIQLREAWAAVPSSSGATVIIPFEIRHATAITTGTAVTPKPLDPGDPAAVAVVRQAPTGITDPAAPLWWTWVEQTNTAQGSTDSTTHELGDPLVTSEVKCITLREGNGCYLRQIATNTSTFRMGFLFTEEPA